MCNSVSRRASVGGGGMGGRGRDGRCLWSILGGFWCQWISRRQEKALDFTVVSKVVWEFSGRMDELVWTSIVTNMNITYKMPHVSTKIYSYIYSMYVQEGLKSSGAGRGGGGRRRRRRRSREEEPFHPLARSLAETEYEMTRSETEMLELKESTAPQLRSITTRRKQQSSGSTETVRHLKKRSHLPSQSERTIDCDANVGIQLA